MEPSKRWLLWVSWLSLIAALFTGSFVIGFFKDTGWELLVTIGLLAVILMNFRPVKQRVEITCEGTLIVLILTVNLLGRVDMHIRVSEKSKPKRIKLGYLSPNFLAFPLCARVWFEKMLEISGETKRLLIYYNSPNGFMVSFFNEAGITPFTVTRNEFCF